MKSFANSRKAHSRWFSALILSLFATLCLATSPASAQQQGVPYGWGLNLFGQTGAGYAGCPQTPVKNSLLSKVVQVSANSNQSVALKSDGTVWQWGTTSGNFLNQGLGETPAPLKVPSLVHITQVCAAKGSGPNKSDSSLFALKSDGTVWQWYADTPTQVPNLTNVVQVDSYVAVKSDGTVWKWDIDSPTPAQVQGLDHIVSVQGDANGGSVVITALKQDGTVWQYMSSNPPQSPSQISGLSQIVQMSGNIFVKSDGTVWSYNGYSGSVQQVSGLTNVTQVGGSPTNLALALKSDGTVWWWGQIFGAEGYEQDTTTPVQLAGLSHVASLSSCVSDYNITSCYAVETDGSVWAWSADTSAAPLGLGYYYFEPAPVAAQGVSNIIQIDSCDYTLALRADGTVFSWGDNGYGELGDGTTISRATPALIPNLTNVIQVACGLSYDWLYSLALKSDGTVWQWGGRWGVTPITSPTQIAGLSSIVQIAQGLSMTLVLKSDGTVWAWGDNLQGELGDGTTTQTTSIVQVQGLSGVVQIAAGEQSSLALKSDGTVWTWGYDQQGETGDGMTQQHNSPVQVQNIPAMSQITLGGGYGQWTAIALALDGTVWVWGNDLYGQMGDGTWNEKANLPAQVPGLTEVTQVGAFEAPFALKSDGTVWVWGNGFDLNGVTSSGVGRDGISGDGTNSGSFTPVMVPSLTGMNFIGGRGCAFALQVALIPTTLSSANISQPYNTAFSVSAKLVDKRGVTPKGKSVSFTLDGTAIGTAVTDKTGTAALQVPNATTLAGGKHTLKAVFAGDSKTKASSASALITITSAATTTTIANASASAGQKINLTATLVRNSDKTALAGEKVRFSVNGATQGTATTDNSGTATLAFSEDATYKTGAYSLKAEFLGDKNYADSSATGTLTIGKAATQAVASDASAKAGQTVTLMAKLLRSTDGKGVQAETLTFEIDGVSVGTAVTNGSGLAKLNYLIPASTKKGKHPITVLFGGDTLYSSGSDGSRNLTVN